MLIEAIQNWEGSQWSFQTTIIGLTVTFFVLIYWHRLKLVNQSYVIEQLKSQLSSQEEYYKSSLARFDQLRGEERKGRISVQQRERKKALRDSELNGYRFKAIAVVESPFPERRGTPRQPLLVSAAIGRIRFERNLVQYDFYKEIEQFSHIWVIFVFHCNTNSIGGCGSGSAVSAKVRPPRLGTKVGCLSTRSPHRPNNIGLSVCRVVRVFNGHIEISGLDLVHGTPIIDIKPYLPCDSIRVDHTSLKSVGYSEAYEANVLTVPSWISEDDVPMRNVSFTEDALQTINYIFEENMIESRKRSTICSDSQAALELIRQVLRQDIRGISQGRGSCSSIGDGSDKSFVCHLDKMEVRFTTHESEIVVTSVVTFDGTCANELDEVDCTKEEESLD